MTEIKGSMLVPAPNEGITGGVTIESPLGMKPRKANKRLKREFKELRREMMKEVKRARSKQHGA